MVIEINDLISITIAICLVIFLFKSTVTHLRHGFDLIHRVIYVQKMGCFFSRELIDFDIIQPLVLRIKRGLASYSGTTERGRFQTLGDAEMALTEDCLYSQVISSRCCDQGVLRIPILSIKDIRQQAYFNGRYLMDHPHMVITYIITDQKGKKEHQAGWQMNSVTYIQWKNAIEQLQNRHPRSEFA